MTDESSEDRNAHITARCPLPAAVLIVHPFLIFFSFFCRCHSFALLQVSAIYFENAQNKIKATAHVWTKSQFSAPQTVKSILEGACYLNFQGLDEVRLPACLSFPSSSRLLPFFLFAVLFALSLLCIALRR